MTPKLCLLASLLFAPLCARAQQQEPVPPAGPKLWFYVTRGDCMKRSRMRVTLQVDGEAHRFTPSCRSEFQVAFISKSGASCQIDSTMCSTDAPRGSMQAVCTGINGGVSTSEDSFSCPRN